MEITFLLLFHLLALIKSLGASVESCGASVASCQEKSCILEDQILHAVDLGLVN